MVKLRLKRLGRKHKAFYRLCAMDIRTPRNGKALEELGFYDPMQKDESKQISFDGDRIKVWLGKGAQPSDTVRDLLARVGLITKPAFDPRRIKKKPGAVEAEKPAEAAQ
ncbi:MAG: 30S ribosomal protein S16 [Phycisphaeraceae bacterium]